jgi:hypothetical protein
MIGSMGGFSYTGYWTGRFEGTNSGGVSLDISQAFDKLIGAATMLEPDLGPPYKYEIDGRIDENGDLKFNLKPLGMLHPLPHGQALILGELVATGLLEDDYSIRGKWSSTIGTNGTFHLSRYQSDGFDPPKPNAEIRIWPRRIFVCYSHADADYMNRLIVHMKPVERKGELELWVDTKLKAGDKWHDEINEGLKHATAAILLVSADFMASEFITKYELPVLLNAARNRGLTIIPLLLKPSAFPRTEILKDFQTANGTKNVVSALLEWEQEEIYDSLVSRLEMLF